MTCGVRYGSQARVTGRGEPAALPLAGAVRLRIYGHHEGFAPGTERAYDDVITHRCTTEYIELIPMSKVCNAGNFFQAYVRHGALDERDTRFGGRLSERCVGIAPEQAVEPGGCDRERQ